MLLVPIYSYGGSKITFTPRVSVNSEYTGNVDLTAENETSDIITTLSPGFDFEASEKTRGVAISYEPGYSRYDKNSVYNTWRHSAQFSGWTGISKRTQLRLNNSFRRSEEPISEEDITIRRGRNPYFTNSASVNLTHQMGKTNSLSLGYVYSILENKAPDIEDSANYSPSIDFSFWFLRHLGLNATVSYNYGEFSDQSDDFNNWKGSLQLTRKFTKHFNLVFGYSHTYMNFKGESEDYQIFDPSIGIDYTIDKGSSISFNVGYFFREREKNEDDSNISISGNIGKVWRVKRGSLNITGSSGYDEAYFGAESLGYNTYEQVQGSAGYQFTKYLNGNISGSYRITDFRDLIEDREDRRTSIGLNFTLIPPIRWLPISIVIGYSYSEVDSTRSENEYRDGRFNLNISTAKTISKPIRLE